jgi:tetratricopeptide (TPR) repeat protein
MLKRQTGSCCKSLPSEEIAAIVTTSPHDLTQPPQVFISYSRRDEAFARRIHEHIQGLGYRVWMDVFDIPVGTRWPDAIDHALNESDIVLGIMSPDSLGSVNVKNEWDWAIANQRRIVLLMLKACQVPFHYVSLNYIDFTSLDAERAFDQLRRSLVRPSASAPIRSPQPILPLSSSIERDQDAGQRHRDVTLFGRGRDRAMLGQALDRAITSHGELVLISGEAGIGKTALVADLLDDAAMRGVLTLTGGCYALTATPPFGPWREMFAHASIDAGQPPFNQDAPVDSQSAIFMNVLDYLITLAAGRPLVLLLEDVHWADPSSLELLRFLARHVQAMPTLLVATFRTDELESEHPLSGLLPILVRESNAERIELRPLGEGDLDAWLTARYGLSSLERLRLVSYLQQRAEGNPFFTGELLRMLIDHTVLSRADEQWSLGDLGDADVPLLLRQVIDQRLMRLPDEDRQMLSMAAIVGHDVPLTVWGAVSGRPDDELLDVIERSIDAGVLLDAGDGTRVRFKHALIRDALYQGVTSMRRRTWHRLIAESLMLDPLPDVDAVAYHLERAGDPRAVAWLIQAGDRAYAATAVSEAFDRYRLALSRMSDDEQTLGQRGWLLMRLARTRETVDEQAGLAHLDEATTIARQLTDAALLVSCHWVRGLLMNRLGEDGLPELTTASQGLLSLLPQDRERLAQHMQPGFSIEVATGVISQRFANVFAHYGRYYEAMSMAEDYLARATPDSSPYDDGEAYHTLGMSYAALGRPVEARNAYEHSIASFRQSRRPEGVTNALYQYLRDVMLTYYPEMVSERAALAVEAERAALFAYKRLALPDLSRSFVFCELLVNGSWSEIMTVGAEHGSIRPALRPALAIFLGTVARYQGHPDIAWKHIAIALPQGPRAAPGSMYYTSLLFLHPLAAHLALDAGDAPTALEWITSFETWLDWGKRVQGRSEAALLRSRYCDACGDLSGAADAAARALDAAREPRQPFALMAAHRLLSERALRSGDDVVAATHAQQARELADACAAPFERALALIAEAEVHVMRGARDVAAAALSDARDLCLQLNASPSLDRVAAIETQLEMDQSLKPA